ncbi:MAG: hypothetical protein AAGG01_11225, partial [Planctomycetota bacterium]
DLISLNRQPTAGPVFKSGQEGQETATLELPNGIALEHLAEGPRQNFPSWTQKILGLDTSPLARPVVIVSEHGSGRTSLSNWFQSIDSSKAVHEIDCQGLAVDTATDFFDSVRDKAQGIRATGTGAALYRRKSSQSESSITPLIIINRPSELQEELRMNVFGRLRSEFESGGYSADEDRVNFLIITSDYLDVVADDDFSAIVLVSDLCRLPRFTAAQISRLAASTQKTDKSPEVESHTDFGRELQMSTGGQPLLVQLALDRARKKRMDKPLRRSDAKAAYRSLRDTPPRKLDAWRSQLARFVQQSYNNRKLVQSLAGGESYRVPEGTASVPAGLDVLSLMGWVHAGPVDRESDAEHERWRFSELHQYWAKDVLLDAAAFYTAKPGSV